MPTINPRVNVTLSPSLFLLVGRLATFQRASKSQVLRELLEAVEPALQRAVALMHAAEQAKGAVRSGIADSFMKAQDKIEAQLAVHMDLADGVTADLVDRAEAVRGRRPARGGVAAPNRVAAPVGAGEARARRPARATRPKTPV